MGNIYFLPCFLQDDGKEGRIDANGVSGCMRHYTVKWNDAGEFQTLVWELYGYESMTTDFLKNISECSGRSLLIPNVSIRKQTMQFRKPIFS